MMGLRVCTQTSECIVRADDISISHLRKVRGNPSSLRDRTMALKGTMTVDITVAGCGGGDADGVAKVGDGDRAGCSAGSGRFVKGARTGRKER